MSLPDCGVCGHTLSEAEDVFVADYAAYQQFFGASGTKIPYGAFSFGSYPYPVYLLHQEGLDTGDFDQAGFEVVPADDKGILYELIPESRPAGKTDRADPTTLVQGAILMKP